MSFLKNCRVSITRCTHEGIPDISTPNVVGVVLELRNVSEVLLFETGVVAKLAPDEFSLRKQQFKKIIDAFASLGVLVQQNPTSENQPLSTSSYLVLVSACSLVGKFPDHEIYRITAVQLLCLQNPVLEDESFPDYHLHSIPLHIMNDTEKWSHQLRKLLSSGAFYFARSFPTGSHYDVTLSIQNRHLINSSVATNDVFTRNDRGVDFLWNAGLMCPLLQWGVNPNDWCVSIICGSFEMSTVYCGREQARIGVISRVSSQRPGTRFHARGVNDRGYVANFVESEQFIYLGNNVISHVQLRGTVPLFWEQPGIQVGSHKIQFSRGLDISMGAFERHFSHILSSYSATAIVNLLGSKQGEASLSRAYQELLRRSSLTNTVTQVIFDYHSEMSSRGVKALDWLQKQLERFVSAWGYFHAVGDTVKRCQEGALRLNCVDCLDRTNAVQTLVGVQLVLPHMLANLQLASSNQSMLAKRFEENLRQSWQQNGDQVSRIYAGTGALGSGRSRLRDVQRSAARTIQHSFFDGAKQEAMRTLLNQSNIHGWMKTVTERYLPSRFRCLPPTLLCNIMSRYSDFVVPQKLRVFVGTWNVNGGKHFRSVAHKNESVTDWLLRLPFTVKSPSTGLSDGQLQWGYKNPSYTHLETEQWGQPMDLFAIGFEEIVDLTTSNIVSGSKSTVNQRDWGEFLQRNLNQSVHARDAYVLISSVQLVGVCLFVFARARLAVLVREISSGCTKTGLGGTAGNKGGVAVSLQLGATTICFVCSHFAAGQSAVRERNDDFNEICRRLTFANGHGILSHDYVFWCGDFNYRINVPGAEVKRLVTKSAWSDLLRSDQLSLERQAGNVFRGFEEGPISFAPTYKYDLFCDEYDTSEKARSPAWTDRILWRRSRMQFHRTDENGVLATTSSTSSTATGKTWDSGTLLIYNRAELKTSDHRPVGAMFDIEVHVITRDARRQVVLDTIHDYGPIGLAVQLNILLVESQSQKPVSIDVGSGGLLQHSESLEYLKSLASQNCWNVALIRILSSNMILVTYGNSKQARLAAKILNGYISPWPTPPLLPSVTGGYELQLTATLQHPSEPTGTDCGDQGDEEWFFPLKRFVEIAERDETTSQGQTIAPDVFQAILPSFTAVAATPQPHSYRDSATENSSVSTYMDLDRRSPTLFGLLDDEDDEDEEEGEDGEGTTPRKPPPRPAPPPRRPPLTPEMANANAQFQGTGLISILPPGASQSTHSSPIHLASGGGCLLPQVTEIQLVSSCLDLLSVSEDDANNLLSIRGLDRPASSVNLIGAYQQPLQSPTAPARPPPLPPRPAPMIPSPVPPVSASSSSSSSSMPKPTIPLLGQEGVMNSELVSADPFSIGDPDSGLATPFSIDPRNTESPNSEQNITRDARRQVVLDTIHDYGPIGLAVQLNILLVESQSQKPVSIDVGSGGLLQHSESLEYLKSLASQNCWNVALIRILSSNMILVTYGNSKQARLAAKILNGYISPWPTPPLLPSVTGGYELQLTATLQHPSEPTGTDCGDQGDEEWFFPLKRFVEIAERDETTSQGQTIAPDVFQAILPSFTAVAATPQPHSYRDSATENSSVSTYMDLDRRSPTLFGLLDDEDDEDEEEGEDGEGTTPRKPPPRPAPPPRRPPLTPEMANANAQFQGTGLISILPPGASQSTHSSPIHLASGGGCLLPQVTEIQLVSSCLDLLSVSEDDANNLLSIRGLDRPASSVNLIGAYQQPLQSPTAPARPPPLPPRPAPMIPSPVPPVSASSSSSSSSMPKPTIPLLGQEGVMNSELVSADPFSIGDPDSGLATPFSIDPRNTESPNSEQNIPPLIPSRPAPMPPPSLPPRPKPSE